MKNDIEKIVCSALHFDDGKSRVHQPKNIKTGIVVCGLRHCNCFVVLSMFVEMNSPYKTYTEQGFLTSHNRFVGRKEAAKIFLTYNSKESLTQSEDELYSEDLY